MVGFDANQEAYMTTENYFYGILVLVLLFAAACAAMSEADAHSWYPKECCSNQDCMPVDQVGANADGGAMVFVGSRRIPIPSYLRARSSPDGRTHICFRTVTSEEGSFIWPICFFRPPQS
jgi:hypothetical protein